MKRQRIDYKVNKTTRRYYNQQDALKKNSPARPTLNPRHKLLIQFGLFIFFIFIFFLILSFYIPNLSNQASGSHHLFETTPLEGILCFNTFQYQQTSDQSMQLEIDSFTLLILNKKRNQCLITTLPKNAILAKNKSLSQLFSDSNNNPAEFVARMSQLVYNDIPIRYYAVFNPYLFQQLADQNDRFIVYDLDNQPSIKENFSLKPSPQVVNGYCLTSKSIPSFFTMDHDPGEGETVQSILHHQNLVNMFYYTTLTNSILLNQWLDMDNPSQKSAMIFNTNMTASVWQEIKSFYTTLPKENVDVFTIPIDQIANQFWISYSSWRDLDILLNPPAKKNWETELTGYNQPELELINRTQQSLSRTYLEKILSQSNINLVGYQQAYENLLAPSFIIHTGTYLENTLRIAKTFDHAPIYYSPPKGKKPDALLVLTPSNGYSIIQSHQLQEGKNSL